MNRGLDPARIGMIGQQFQPIIIAVDNDGKFIDWRAPGRSAILTGMKEWRKGIDQCAGTARFIARCLEVADCDGRYTSLLPAGCGELNRQLLRAAGDDLFLRAAQYRLFQMAFLRGVDLVLPGIVPHYLARKRCLEDEVRRACGEYRQVVVLCAGLDTLVWRLHRRLPEVRFIEIDRPAALDIKERAMIAAGMDLRNLTLLPADLANETLPDVLRRCSDHRRDLSTLFLAEGLLMYLTPASVNSLLDEIWAQSSPDTRNCLAVTFMEAREGGRIGFRCSSPLVNWWLRRGGEPFRWSVDPAKISAWLGSKGWHVQEILSDDALRTRYLKTVDLRGIYLAEGECIALAHAISSR